MSRVQRNFLQTTICCSGPGKLHRRSPDVFKSGRNLSAKVINSCRKLVLHQYTAIHFDINSAVDSVVQVIMPRERGDIRDAALMTFSVALFCVLGAQLYGIYLHLYLSAGLRPILQF